MSKHPLIPPPALTAERALIQMLLTAFPLSDQQGSWSQLDISDWPAVIAAAQRHELAPLLYAALQRLDGLATVPPPSRAWLHRLYLQQLAMSALQYRALERLLAALAAARIPVVLLKGCAVGPLLYENRAYRPMHDLDLLIPKSAVPRVLEILKTQNYASISPTVALCEGFAEAFSAEHHYVDDSTPPIHVEPHWHVINNCYYMARAPIEWFWRHTTTVSLNDQQALILTAEAQFLHLSAHLMLHHLSGPLRWSYDLALLLGRYGEQVRWDELATAAREFELLIPLQRALRHIQDRWGVAAPAEAQTAVYHPKPHLREILVFTALTKPASQSATFFWKIVTLPGLRQKLRYLSGNLFPSRAYMRQRYDLHDDRFLPLYYGRRIVTFPPKFLRRFFVSRFAARRVPSVQRR